MRVLPAYYVADVKPEERSALCLLLDLKIEVVGEAAACSTKSAKSLLFQLTRQTPIYKTTPKSE